MLATPPRLRRSGARRDRVKRSRVGFVRGRSYPRPSTVRLARPLYVPRPRLLPFRLQNTHIFYIEDSFSAGSFGVVYFRANGMFSVTSTPTHQPMGFDQLSNLYGKYVVVASKIHVRILSGGTDGGSVSFGVAVSDQQPTPSMSSMDYIGSMPSVRLGKGSTESDFGGVTQFYNPRVRYGGDVVDNPDLYGTGTSDPVTDAYYIVGFGGYKAGLDSLVGVAYSVRIEYSVIWGDYIAQVMS